ncbi:MAG: hypothetical protein QOI63_54, partial [Thermoplasmata archaeon]|nr:hypothetical protein [Thermoplasmata archaeon]
MPMKGDRRWHRMLLHDPRVADWYENRARRSRRSADESLRRIARGTFDALGKTPLDLLAMDQEELENAVSKCIAFHLDQKKLLGSTTNSFYKTLKSFLKWHRRKVERENYIPGAEEYPNAEDATIPDQDALRAALRAATPKTAVMLAVVAQGGQRECVLGGNDGDKGLRLGAFLEMKVTEDDVIFTSVPTRVEVERDLSKNKKRYFFFLGPEACQLVRAYL